MLQKKRDEFRKQIRRTHIEKFMENKRNELLSHQANIETLNQVDSIFVELETILLKQAKQSLGPKIQESFEQKGWEGDNQEECQGFKEMKQLFNKLKAVCSKDYQKIFTKYMMDKNSAIRVMKMFQDLVRNQVQSEDQSDDPQPEQSKTKYSSIFRDYTIAQLLKFLDTLQYFAMGQIDSVFLVLNGLWQLLGDELLFSQKNQYLFLNHTLSILSKLLMNSKHTTFYNYLKQKGIGSQIIKLIDRFRKMQLPLEIHSHLLKLIDNHLALQLRTPPSIPDTIGGVTIETSNVNENQILLVYCIIFIDKKEESVYPTIFSAISKIFQIHQFLAGSLKPQYLLQVCKLTLNPKREIQNQSLILLNDFTYYSQENLDFLIQGEDIFNILYQRLMIEKAISDEHVTKNVQKIAYILCNSLLTTNPKLKAICLKSYIWEEVFASLHPSNKLFPLILTMTYFLEAHGHKHFQKYFKPYLQTLRTFEWDLCNYSEAIRQSIMRVFSNAQHWQDYEYELFLRVMHQNGFYSMIRDLVDQDDDKLIRQIQVQ